MRARLRFHPHPPLEPLPDPIPLKIQFPIGKLSRRRSAQIYTFLVPRPRGLIAKNTAGTRTSKDFLSQTGAGGDLASQLQSPAAHPGPRPEEA